MRLVLASASPRRSELLRAAGLAFDVRPSAVAEDLAPGISPEDGAVLLAERKARAVAAELAGTDAIVLGADTIVAIEGSFLGKPADADEARSMLRRLSASRHAVVTGICAVRARDGVALHASERTFVTMRAISPAEIEDYVASREWEGKAGGYAIQETADRFVVRLEEGGLDNVVGLPVALVRGLLARLEAASPG